MLLATSLPLPVGTTGAVAALPAWSAAAVCVWFVSSLDA